MRYSFDLIWHERAEVPSMNRAGETVHMTVPFARTVICESQHDALVRRRWHMEHPERWLPRRALSAADGWAPEITEVVER